MGRSRLLDALMRQTRLSPATAVRCLKQFNAHGFIDWIRRTERTGNAPGEGPQVRQVSNAYFFDMTRLPERCFKWLKEKLGRKGKFFDPPRYPPKPYMGLRERRAQSTRTRRDNLAAGLAAATTPAERAAALNLGQAEQRREYIGMATPSLSGAASSETGLNPSSTGRWWNTKSEKIHEEERSCSTLGAGRACRGANARMMPPPRPYAA